MGSTALPVASRLSPADRLEIEFRSRKASHKARKSLWKQLRKARTYDLLQGLKTAKRKQLSLAI